MTAPTLTIRPAGPDTATAASEKAPREWPRRWYKLLVPLVIALVLTCWTLTAHALQSVDVNDGSYLNPTSSAPHGSLGIATRLRADGITVQRVTSTAAAFSAIRSPATLFIPAPALVEPIDLRVISALPPGTRVVLVAPDAHTVQAAQLPVSVGHDNWATHAAAPGCGLPEAQRAGAAAVDDLEYVPLTAPATSCYRGSLIDLHEAGIELTVVGAADPFRNDRISEHANAALAQGLLGSRPTVVWLDLHRAESITPTPIATVSGTDIPGGGGGDNGGDSEPQGSIAGLFPGWLWTALGLALLVGVVLAAAAARRLGPPVSEPMAVAPRANESIEGRGRLYRRTGDRKAAFGMLRAAVVARLTVAANLPAGASDEDIVAAMAARTGWDTDEIDDIMFAANRKPGLKDGPALVAAVARLDTLAHAAGL